MPGKWRRRAKCAWEADVSIFEFYSDELDMIAK